MKTLYESLLDDLDELVGRSDKEVAKHDKVGKYYKMISSRYYSDSGQAVLNVYGTVKKILNMFDSKKIKAFNKELPKFDNVGIWDGYNVSTRKKFADNKIEPLCNILLNMDKKWIEENNCEAIKEYISNIVKDGWDKYLIIRDGFITWSNRHEKCRSFLINCGLCPNCTMEIYFEKK